MQINGIRLDAPPYPARIRAIAIRTIELVRCAIELPTDALKGDRFRDNSRVLTRLESGATADEFMASPMEAVRLALIDAAESDWWYTYEKDWGYDREDNEPNEDDGE